MRHFADALTDSRADGGAMRAWVRSMQVAALRNQHGLPADAALLALVNTMRVQREPIDSGMRDSLKEIYYGFGRDAERTSVLLKAAPAAEQAATLAQLAFVDRPMRIVLAQLFEAAGQRDQALQAWRALRADPSIDSETTAQADAAISHLTSAVTR